MKTYSKLILFLLAMHFVAPAMSQEEWTVPERKKKMNAPLSFDRSHIKAGKTIYYKQCASCHGDMGLKNYKDLVPIPDDLASERIAFNTDGELFFKITNGRSLMPQFEGVLGEMEIWYAIAYLRSFHPIYIKETGLITEAEKFDGDSVIIETEALQESRRIKMRILGSKSGNTYPIESVAVGVYTPRLFGELLIGSIVETDDYGFAFVNYPEGLPGDEEGMLELTIKLEDEDVFGNVSRIENMKVGAPSNPVNILEGRHLWSTRDRAPLWLLFSFFGIIAGIWGTIMYIVFKLATIRRIKA